MKKLTQIIILAITLLATQIPVLASETNTVIHGLELCQNIIKTILPIDIDKYIQNMSIEEKVGQLLLIPYPDQDTNIEEYTLQYNPCGYILYGRDTENKTREELTNMIQQAQKASKTKLFIAVDEEGGEVNRISSNTNFRSKPFNSIRNIYQEQGIEGIIQNTKEKDELLLSLGINLNLGPVCDISTDPTDFMYERSLGLDADTTATVISEIVKQMNKDNISSCLKHFPGYGNNNDTHINSALDTRSLKDLQQNDFKPFIAGINEQCNMIMLSHNVIWQIDFEKPTSLSSKVNNILRNELQFDNIIITDDINMDALSQYNNLATLALIAGNDIIITSTPYKTYNELIQAYHDGDISEKQINTSIKRILTQKQKMIGWG